MKRLFGIPLALQLFAEDDGAGSPQFVSFDNQPNIQAGPPTLPPNPLLAGNPGQPIVTDPNISPASPQVEELDFGGRKIPVVDPSVKDLHGDYTELTRTLQTKDQQLRQMEQQMQFMQQQQQMWMMQQQQQAQQPVAPAQPSAEEIQAMNEKWMENFYSNPQDAISSVVQQALQSAIKPIQEAVQPIQQERQIQQQLQQLSAKYPDVGDMIPQMQQVISQRQDLMNHPQGLEYAYMFAKANSAPSQAQPTATVAPDQLLQDPNVRQQLISNPDVRQAIIRDYLNSVNQQQQNNVTPPVMGNQPGGQAPMLPPNTPKNLKDGTKAWKASGWASS